jgi:cell division protein FtsB
MNAQELTERYHKQSQEISELKKQVDYLTQECRLLRRFVEDAQIDIKMLQNRR